MHTDRHLERLFIFAMMWSLGAVLELDARTKMAEFMTKLPGKMDWPGAKSKEWIMPFEYMVNETGVWQHWLVVLIIRIRIIVPYRVLRVHILILKRVLSCHMMINFTKK